MSNKSTNPTRPDRYKLDELLHEGATGQLYRAEDSQTGKPVLLKIVSKAVSREPDFRRYIHDRWAEQENLFEHPNIAQVIDLGRFGDRYYMAIEDPGGTSLQKGISEAPMETDEALELLHQVAEGLRAAHRRNIYHGHLKPSDIYVTRDSAGRPLVKLMFLDMGTTAGDSMLTVFGETMGSPKYMAPEIIQGGSPHPGADIFSLGVIGYELLTGREPFESSHPIGYLFANCEASYVPPHELNEDIPHEVSRVISRCLERDPNKRYGAVQRVVDDLDRCVQTLKTGQVSVVPAGTDSAFAREYEVSGSGGNQSGNGRSWPVLNVIAILLAVGALGFSLFINRRQNAPEDPPQKLPSSQEEPQAQAQSGEDVASREEDGAREAQLGNARTAYEAALQAWQQRYSLQGNYEFAAAEFKRIALQYPDTPYAERAQEMQAQIHCEWARSLVEEENYKKAVAQYKKALQVAPENSQYREVARGRLPKIMARHAEYAYERGLYEEALQIYKKIKEEFPGTLQASLLSKREPRILLNQGFVAWQQDEDLEEALETFQDLLDKYPHTAAAEESRKDLPDLYLDMARQRMENGELEGALEELATLREVFPENQIGKQASQMEADVLYQLYHRARAAGNDAEARKHFDALTKRHPHSKWAQRALRHQLDLVAEKGEVLLNETNARNRLDEAQEALDEMRYESALTKLRSIARYTSPESKAGQKAIDLLPQCIYRQAVHQLGLGNAEQFRKKLQTVESRFSFSPWADRATRTLRQNQETPAGMIYVPEGRFYMGAQKSRIVEFMEPFYPERVIQNEQELNLVLQTVGYISEIPRHVASTEAYYIDKTEVTNEEYKRFIDATEHPPPAQWQGKDYPEGTADMPITGVSFDDAQAYAEWAGKTLPTEQQWEKAARGTDGRFFPWGNVFEPKACRHMQKTNAGPAAVGSYPGGASPYGALDLTGNVWEWTRSVFQPYPGQDASDERAPYGSDHRVLRGGAWPQHDLQPIPTRVTFRFPATPDRQSKRLGFRCVSKPE